MTSVLTTRDSVRDAVTAAAAAAARTLPIAATVEAPLDDQVPGDLLPGGAGGRAISVDVRGSATGRLVLVVADALATALEDSPFGQQELLAALGPALADAGTALEQFSGAGLVVETGYELEPGVALGAVAQGQLFGASLLHSAGEHVATLALLLDAPSAAPTIPEQRPTASRPVEFEPLTSTSPAPGATRSLELLHDVEMGVTAELGRTRMTIQDLLALTPGSVVELDRAAGSPVDVLVNGTLIARGEVVVIDEEFGIRISEIVSLAAGTAARR